MQYLYKQIFAGIQTPMDKHTFHINIVFVFTTILLLYQFDILLLKQKKLPVLDITHFILRISAFIRVKYFIVQIIYLVIQSF
jgi:hypothetical protein